MAANEIADILLNHIRKYPSMELTDALKLIHQNVFGGGHLVTDEIYSLKTIEDETAGLPDVDANDDIFTYIGNKLYRLDLRALRTGALSPETLNKMFMFTSGRTGSMEDFEHKAAVLVAMCEDGRLPFPAAETRLKITESRAAGHPAKSHSLRYKAAYAPAYRMADKMFYEYYPLFCKIDELTRIKQTVNIAIDGNSASGKTTLAALLKRVYTCNVFTMDDFFLQQHQRTPERLDEPGGNIDYERFADEVAAPLKNGGRVAYRAYDCGTMRLSEVIKTDPAPVNIVEGVYSLHPRYARIYDIKVFISLEESEQRRRLKKRDAFLYERFLNEWIPMERKYFEHFNIAGQCGFNFPSTNSGY